METFFIRAVKNQFNLLLFFVVTMTLNACSGGGGSDSDDSSGDNPSVLGDVIRISVDNAGNEVIGGGGIPSISDDGRYVAFESGATSLVVGDTNGVPDIFVHDTAASTTTRVSVDSAGTEANDYSLGHSISGDGRYVAFGSEATNLVVGDTNGDRDVFVHDTVTSTTTRVSVDSIGMEGNGGSGGSNASISGDGRYVAFDSTASNLVAGDTNGVQDIFVRDTVASTTTRVSVDSGGIEGNQGSEGPVSISSSGRYIAFASSATNLVAGDTNGTIDIFVHDTVTSATIRVSVDSAGMEGNGQCYRPSISGDGRYVAFVSRATNLVAGDTNGTADIFVHDTVASTTSRVSVDSAGVEGNDESSNPSISGDGRFVAFDSYANLPLFGYASGGIRNVYVHDTVTSETFRASVDSAGGEGNNDSADASINFDGQYVAFGSAADNLVAGDTNGGGDVFRKTIDR